MSTTTQRLGLFKYDTVADSAVPFNIDDALNYNWDILDEKIRSGRNIGELVYSSLPLTDAGLHLLDGSLILGEGIYQEFVDYMAELYDETAVIGYKSNVTKIGSLTDDNGVLSGFSTSNYGNIGNFPGNTASYEIVIKFMTSNVSSTEIFLGHNTPGSSSAYYTPQLRISNTKLCTYGPTNAGIVGTTTLLANTWYWAKVKWNGTQKELWLSTDGQTFTSEGTISVSTSLTGGTLLIGNGTGESSLAPFTQGTIDLKESYIDINGERWWTGAEAIKPMFCTEEQWQTSVNNYGVCGKFVYDSVNDTVRLPKITGMIEGTVDINALGNLIEAGLPNITGETDLAPNAGFRSDFTATGAYYKSTSVSYSTNFTNSSSGNKLGFKASRSNAIYGNSDTVQPQTIQCFVYIVVAQSIKSDYQIDIEEIIQDLNGKVDKGDLTEVQCVVESYQNGTSGYRVWSDGYCEQWGYINRSSSGGSATAQVTFLKPYKDTNWHGVCSGLSSGGNAWGNTGFNKPTSTTQGIISEWITGTGTFNDIFWITGGYII